MMIKSSEIYLMTAESTLQAPVCIKTEHTTASCDNQSDLKSAMPRPTGWLGAELYTYATCDWINPENLTEYKDLFAKLSRMYICQGVGGRQDRTTKTQDSSGERPPNIRVSGQAALLSNPQPMGKIWVTAWRL